MQQAQRVFRRQGGGCHRLAGGSEIVQNLRLAYTLGGKLCADLFGEAQEHLAVHLDRSSGVSQGRKKPAGCAWLGGRFELIVSPALLAELTGVFERPKFRRWLTVEEARAFV